MNYHGANIAQSLQFFFAIGQKIVLKAYSRSLRLIGEHQKL